jgi:hypothetical protein
VTPVPIVRDITRALEAEKHGMSYKKCSMLATETHGFNRVSVNVNFKYSVASFSSPGPRKGPYVASRAACIVSWHPVHIPGDLKGWLPSTHESRYRKSGNLPATSRRSTISGHTRNSAWPPYTEFHRAGLKYDQDCSLTKIDQTLRRKVSVFHANPTTGRTLHQQLVVEPQDQTLRSRSDQQKINFGSCSDGLESSSATLLGPFRHCRGSKGLQTQWILEYAGHQPCMHGVGTARSKPEGTAFSTLIVSK